jgi:hypothetical protein
VEFPESFGDFLPLLKEVGAVQQEDVQPISAQAPRIRVDAFQNVFAAENQSVAVIRADRRQSESRISTE